MQKILLVDDDQDYLRNVCNLFSSRGMSVKCVASGLEALSELETKFFALMITDLNMEGMDGFALTRKALSLAPNMPVIMITGSISPELTRLAAEAGIAKVFTKAFDSDELIDLIRELQDNSGGDFNGC